MGGAARTDAYENVGLYCDGEATLREQGLEILCFLLTLLPP